MSAGIRLGTATAMAGDDRGPQAAFGEVMIGGHSPVVGLMIEASGIGPEDRLDTTDTQVLRRLVHRGEELSLDLGRFPEELGIRGALGPQPHR